MSANEKFLAEEILYKSANRVESATSAHQTSSQNLILLPFPTFNPTQCLNSPYKDEMYFHGLRYVHLLATPASHLLDYNPNLLVMTFAHKDSCSKGNLHNHLKSKALFSFLDSINAQTSFNLCSGHQLPLNQMISQVKGDY